MIAVQKRKYSRPVITKSLVMNSEASIIALDSYINKSLNNLYALDVILFYIGDDSVAEKANEKVQDIFNEKLALFTKDIQKYQKTVDEADMDMASYTGTQQKEFKVYSPLASVYLKMMGKFELLTNLIDTIWLNGELSSRVRKDRVVKLSAHMRNVSAQVSNIARNAMQLAKAQGKEAEASSKLKELKIDSDTVVDQEESTEESKPAKKMTKTALKKNDDSDLPLSEIIKQEQAKQSA